MKTSIAALALLGTLAACPALAQTGIARTHRRGAEGTKFLADPRRCDPGAGGEHDEPDLPQCLGIAGADTGR